MNENQESINKPKFLSHIFGAEESYLRSSSQVHILRQELHSGILPIGGKSKNYKNFDITVTGTDSEIALNTLSSLKKINHRKIKEGVCDVVNRLTQNLTHFGFSHYELVEQDKGVSLHYIPKASFYDFGFVGVQVVPRQQRMHVKKTLITRSKKHIWRINFPDKICSFRCYLRILANLTKNTSLAPRNIAQSDIFNRSSGFDFLQYNKQSKIYIYRVLNKIGGTQRDTNLENTTEFYLVNRMIRLFLSKTLLREHVVNEINMLFRRLKIDSEISVKGLPSSDDVREILRELQEGKSGIEESLAKSNVY